MFLRQMVLGAVLGFALGWALVWLLNPIGLETEGLYPVLTLSCVLLAYGGDARSFQAALRAGIGRRRRHGNDPDGFYRAVQLAGH